MGRLGSDGPMKHRRSPRLAVPLSLALAIPAAALAFGASPAARADVVASPPVEVKPVPAKPAPAKPQAAKPAKPAPEPAPEAAPPDPAASAAAVPGLDELPPEIAARARELLAIKWQPGPVSGSLGDVAELSVPEDVVFADADGARRYLEINQNPTSGNERGMVAAADLSWVMIFEFSDIGYVDDEEKEELDADAILQSLREGNAQSNEIRRSRGWGTVSLIGWAEPPRYEPNSHNLEWATKGQNDQDQGITINHNIRILGRRGVMEATLLVSPEEYATVLPAARKLLESFSYKAGERYAEYRKGDRIAQVGLIGLMTGGAVAAAAKTGILAKLGKGAVKIIAVIGAGAAALLSRLFGRKKDG